MLMSDFSIQLCVDAGNMGQGSDPGRSHYEAQCEMCADGSDLICVSSEVGFGYKIIKIEDQVWRRHCFYSSSVK